MEDYLDGSVSPPLQPVRINWQTPDDLNDLSESHVELDLDYDIVRSTMKLCSEPSRTD
jgi:hypothetical protein